MSKSNEQIAADCGMSTDEAKMLKRVMNQVDGSKEPYPNMLEEIIGALYRRIEMLEGIKAYAEIVAVDLADYLQRTEDETGVVMNYGIEKLRGLAKELI